MRNKSTYESLSEKEKAIVEILFKHQEELSDGYGWYCSYFVERSGFEQPSDVVDRDEWVVTTALAIIAREIIEVLNVA